MALRWWYRYWYQPWASFLAVQKCGGITGSWLNANFRGGRKSDAVWESTPFKTGKNSRRVNPWSDWASKRRRYRKKSAGKIRKIIILLDRSTVQVSKRQPWGDGMNEPRRCVMGSQHCQWLARVRGGLWKREEEYIPPRENKTSSKVSWGSLRRIG